MSNAYKVESICILCGVNLGTQPEFAQYAQKLAVEMLKKDIGLIYGGCSAGLTKIIVDEFMKNEKSVTGIVPRRYLSNGTVHPGVTKTMIADDMYSRIEMMMQYADAFIIMPGGFGTYSELFNILYSIRLGNLSKPCAVFNICGFFDGMLSHMDSGIKYGFLEQHHKDILFISAVIDDIFNYFMNYKPIEIPLNWK